MKDSYSFDRDEAGLDASFRAHEARLPPDLRALRARVLRGAGRVGDDGRQRVDRLPRAVGLGREHARHLRERRLRRRPRGRARRAAAAGLPAAARRRREEVETPGRRRRARRWRRSSAIDVAATSKAMPVTKDDGTVVLALVRGDDRLELAKLAAALGEDVRPATEDEIRAAFGADPGSLGPVGFDGEIVADETLREGQFVAGANRTGWHLARRRDGPRLRGALRRPARADRGRPLLHVRRRAPLPDGDRGRPHLQARHAVLGAARGDVPRRGRKGEAARDGQLRDRPRPDHGRGRRAAPRRRRASCWPPCARARTTCTSSRCPGWSSRPRRRRDALATAGVDVLLDDRDAARGREVRRRRPDRAPVSGHRGEEDPRGRDGRRRDREHGRRSDV